MPRLRAVSNPSQTYITLGLYKPNLTCFATAQHVSGTISCATAVWSLTVGIPIHGGRIKHDFAEWQVTA